MSQVRRLMRRLQRNATGAGGGMSAPLGMAPRFDPAEEIAREQEYRRNALAERLLEVGLEELSPNSFTDTHELVEIPGPEGGRGYTDAQERVTVEEWYVKLSHAALAAAEVIYPEVPEPDRMTAGEYARSRNLPPAAQAGAQSVVGEG